MTDYMLRAENESDMNDALLAAGVAQEVADLDGEIFVVAIEGITLDRIGPIPAQVDEEGIIVRPGDPRYHANIRVTFELTPEQIGELPTFTPEPTIPYRVFA
jgi:hypothetical protein